MVMEAVQLSYAAPQTVAGRKCQCHPRRGGAVEEHDAGRQYPNWCCFRVNAVYHIICLGHARPRRLDYGNNCTALTEKNRRDVIGRLSNCHPRHHGWLCKGIVSAITDMDGFGRLSICHPRHRGWLREGIVSAVTTWMDLEGIPIIICGTADGFVKGLSAP